MVYFMRIPLIIAALMVGAATASANHMNGRYTLSRGAESVNLEIRQMGTTLSGQLSGANQGTFNGQTDGGNNAFGTINLGYGDLQFQGSWTPAGFTFRIPGPNMMQEYVFTTGGTGQVTPASPDPMRPPALPATPAAPPPLPASDVQYYVTEQGQQVGPLTLDQVRNRLATGATQGSDLAWKAGLGAWTRVDSLAELAPTPQPPTLPVLPNGPPPVPPLGTPPLFPGAPTPNPPGQASPQDPAGIPPLGQTQ